MRRSKNGKQNTCISFKFWPRSQPISRLLFRSPHRNVQNNTSEWKKGRAWSRSFTSAIATPKKPQLPYAQTYTESQKYLWPEHTKIPNAVYKFVYWHVRSQIALWIFFFSLNADASAGAGCQCFTSIFYTLFMCTISPFAKPLIRGHFLYHSWSSPLFHAYCRSTYAVIQEKIYINTQTLAT